MNLPDHPSFEHLRKQAKRLAKAGGLRLSAAQHKLARDYDFPNWAALKRAVAARSGRSLAEAAARGDVAAVEALLAAGAPVDGPPDARDTPLYLACAGDAPDAARLAIARRLIEADAHVRRGCAGGATPLHVAARTGPAAMVELLLRSGGLAWQQDAEGRRPHDYAQDGKAAERERILYITADGPKIDDSDFRAAVAAIHAGDAAGLARLLDARPSLLTEPAIEPDLGPRGYFSDPMLFWFVANNPTLIPRPPANIVEIAELMIARGVRQEDLDYALELVMTDGMMPRPMQMDLVRALHAAGAVATDKAVLMTLGHGQRAPIAWLVEHGLALTPAAAAGLGRIDALPGLLARAPPEEKQEALAAAVINRESEAVRLALEAGADPSRLMPVHAHSTPLHQAALHEDLETMRLLVSHGARLDIRDTLWRATPLMWAVHEGKTKSEAFLRSLE